MRGRKEGVKHPGPTGRITERNAGGTGKKRGEGDRGQQGCDGNGEWSQKAPSSQELRKKKNTPVQTCFLECGLTTLTKEQGGGEKLKVFN